MTEPLEVTPERGVSIHQATFTPPPHGTAAVELVLSREEIRALAQEWLARTEGDDREWVVARLVFDGHSLHDYRSLRLNPLPVEKAPCVPYVETKCPLCGWFHLIGPGERDHPCERDTVSTGCPGKVSDPDDRTFECVPQGFKARVAALLRKIEWRGGCCGGKRCPCEDCDSGEPSCGQTKHA
ncbi:MAG: hypothetical protein NUW22_09030, partial [Acidobacteria bacterium]|nr:hypothetical protein [Acidobacteriota bacterium]